MNGAVCRGLTAGEIEQQYALRKLRPAYEKEMVPGWLERSARFRAEHPNALIDLAYGPGQRDRFDLFPAADPKGPFLVYIHGGYWQRGDKSVYSILARPFTQAGIDVALVNYDLCPAVALTAIAPQLRRAVAHLWRQARDLGCPRKRFCVMGHSAGGHLAAEISTIHRAMPTDAPQLVAWGENETPDWRRQSLEYVERFSTAERRIEAYVVPGADHFDVVDVLADADSVLTARARALILG